MNYTSTRDKNINITACEAVSRGISREGGLFVPVFKSLPKLTETDILALAGKSYAQRATEIFKPFFPEISDAELSGAAATAYGGNFDKPDIIELVKLGGTYALELWHGPTCAFKDMALQFLPELLKLSLKKTGKTSKTLILVATSGDTGKAALEGFKDVPDTEIAVFYPEDGVSDMQKLQMTTQEGGNVHVFAVKGNFDDCQNGVKAAFTDAVTVKRAEERGFAFSSANSINWGRLSPQIVYYISAYAELVRRGEIAYGEKVNVCVPTGNFGNILAAYYAKEAGIPFGKLICASNANKILADFINTGVYDRNRDFYTTISPSMDILISSNLERLLYHLCDNDDALINEWFSALKTSGRYEVGAAVKSRLKDGFYGGWCGEADTKAEIKHVFDVHGYLLDPHTAVGFKVYADYKNETGDGAKTIIAGTANPYKFGDAVYGALSGFDVNNGGFETIEKLEDISGVKAPCALTEIKNKPVRFKESVDKSGIKEAVLRIIEGAKI